MVLKRTTMAKRTGHRSMSKFATKHFKPTDLFDFKTHWAVGLEYPIEGSKGNTILLLLPRKVLRVVAQE